VGERRDFKFGVHVDHSISVLQTTNCLWKGRGHVTWPILHF